MSITIHCRYQKKDQFGSEVFIASQSKEQESFEIIKGYTEKLKGLNLCTFLPVYHGNTENPYTTIRFKHCKSKVKLEERNTYKITFSFRKVTRDDKQYINCYVESIELISKAPDIDFGEVLEL